MWRILCYAICISLLFTIILGAEKIELKNGRFIEGTVKGIKDGTVTVQQEESEIGIPLDQLSPRSMYQLKSRFMEQDNAQSHWELGEYCAKNKMYESARKEYSRAAELDESLKDKADEKTIELVDEECRDEIEKAFALMRQSKYEESLQVLRTLIDKYPESNYVEEASRAATFAAEALRNKIEDEKKKKELEVKQKELERLSKEEIALRNKFNEAAKLVGEARNHNIEGLTSESDLKVVQADKSYKKAEEKLFAAHNILKEVMNQTKDVDLISEIKEKVNEVAGWLATTYNNLGQLWALELNIRESIKWLNKALAIDPYHKAASDLKVKLIEIQARQKLLQQENR